MRRNRVVSMLAGVVLAVSWTLAQAEDLERPGSGAVPPGWVLDELARKLGVERPECRARGDCAKYHSAIVSGGSGTVSLEMEVHSGDVSEVRLPSYSGGELVAAQGSGKAVFRSLPDGGVAVAVPKGISKLRLSWRTRGGRLDVSWQGAGPMSVKGRVEGWDFDPSLDGQGRLTALSLVARKVEKQEAKGADESEAVVFKAPLRLHVERSVSVRTTGTTVSTTVRRLSPVAYPDSGEFGLVSGEEILGDGLAVRSGSGVRVSFPEGVSTVSFESKIPSPAFELTASVAPGVSESWSVRTDPRLLPKTQGAEPKGTGADGSVTWDPFPGDKVSVSTNAPKPVAGNWLAWDGVRMSTEYSISTRRHLIKARARAAIAGEAQVSVPASWKLESLSVGGVATPLSGKDGKYRIRLPGGGTEVALTFNETVGFSWFESAPVIDMGGPSANVEWMADVSQRAQRWVLFTGGSAAGPAVLLPGWLALLAALAFGLSRWIPRKGNESWLPGLPGWLALTVPLGLNGLAPVLFVAAPVAFMAWLGTDRGGSFMAAGPERAKRVLGGLCVLGALALVSGIYGGLVGNPESMQQAHHLTGRTMAWYSDLAKNGFLDAWWFSLPIWAWRGMMLVWALAMVKGLTNMLPKAWARWRVLADKGPA